MKKLIDFYNALNDECLVVLSDIGDEETKIEKITFDSREVSEDTLFFCKGASFLPEFLDSAVSKGAKAYISEEKYDQNVPYIIVSDIRKAMAISANLFYEKAWEKLGLVGVTGTKGKSTTVYYIKTIFDTYAEDNNLKETAVISGIDTYDGVIFKEAHLTTPESFELHEHFRNAVDSDIKYLTMEVSSQGLAYDRTYGITFDVGCFLNIAKDHISPIEHSNFDEYLEAKLELFKISKTVCVNLDSDHIDKVLSAIPKNVNTVTFSTQNDKADLYAKNIRKIDGKLTFNVENETYMLAMPGLFNIENALCAIGAARSLNIPEKYIKEGLKKATAKGRMEMFQGEKKKTIVIVDYAHNQLSFEKLFSSMHEEYPEHKIFAIYGCPGKKALDRRRELAEIASKYSEKVYITEEDHGEEDLNKINLEIAANVTCDYEIIEDREEAVKKAIHEADDKTIILLTGKGRETRQKRGKEYIETKSDVDYVEMYLT